MPRPSSGSVNHAEGDGRRSLVAGVIGGIIALGCCVGPVAAAAVGITSATVAVDLATGLYSRWGWAFKLAGAAVAAGIIVFSARRRRACDVKPRIHRTVAIVAIAGIATYGLLYAGTTWLGRQATAAAPLPAIRVEGSTTGARVESAVSQVRRHYPHVRVELKGFSPDGVTFSVGWQTPNLPPLSDEYTYELRRRVEDSREATIVLLRSIARSNPAMNRFSASEEQLIIPIWSRGQILRADPRALRDFGRYTDFVFSATDRSGYVTIFGGEGAE